MAVSIGAPVHYRSQESVFGTLSMLADLRDISVGYRNATGFFQQLPQPSTHQALLA